MPTTFSVSTPTERALLWSIIGLSAFWLQHHVRRSRDKRRKFRVPSALQHSPYAQKIQVAVDLALKAGSNMIPYCDEKGTEAEANHDLGIVTKTHAENFYTKIDVENERLVTEGLLKHFPSHCIIGEESTGINKVPRLTERPTWIVDPIDGTTNFASGLPLTCVSIGYCEEGRPVLGVIYAPMTDELYLAAKGYGAFRNGVKISKRTSKPLLESVVCVEFGYARDKSEIARMVGAVQRVLEHGCRTVRIVGSGVLDLCYVATGRLDVVYAGVASEGWKPWDYCAAMVVAIESGCSIESIDQEVSTEFDIYSTSVICAVGLELLRDVRGCILNCQSR